MMVLQQQFFLYFGDQKTAYIDDSLHGYTQQQIMQLPGYKEFCEQSNCNQLILLEQVHGGNGYAVRHKQDADILPYRVAADYSISTVSGVALAIETADCVPLILIDPKAGCIAAIHAGWRGAVSGVVLHAVRDMLACGSTIEQMQAYFGPSARSCCYQVSADFSAPYEYKNGAYYFDNTTFIIGQLLEIAFLKENIVTHHANCTICSERYCSFRRQGALALRQITIVALK